MIPCSNTITSQGTCPANPIGDMDAPLWPILTTMETLIISFSGPEGLYWFENQDIKTWIRRDVGELPIRALGANVMDVDQDGWMDGYCNWGLLVQE